MMESWITLALILGAVGVTFAELQNLRPIIGVLAQHPPSSITDGLEDGNYTSYIAASYVKFLESAGARVVPILTFQEDSYYENLASSLNGILFTGGAVSITPSSGYGDAGRKLYDLVFEANSKGVYLPLWGTCLGFEMLTYLAANNTKYLASCHAQNNADPLQLQDGYSSSRIFAQMPDTVVTTLREVNSTINFHRWCITPENFTVSGLVNDFKLLATTYDSDGLEYVSLMEHNDLPVFGSQFHPEKNAFEWANDDHHNSIPHEPESIEAAQYFANFFVTQARQNNQKFATREEEDAALIYNYEPIYSTWSSFTQVYLFR